LRSWLTWPPKTNCLLETCFDRALAAARARDEHLSKTGKPLGPFHGLPISLKDSFNLKGLDTTLGLVANVGEPAESDSTLVKLLESLGAVIYVKTNVPVGLMMTETVNNITGRTLNPRNKLLTPGGSSGGEAALVLLKGSPLGIGSDLGRNMSLCTIRQRTNHSQVLPPQADPFVSPRQAAASLRSAPLLAGSLRATCAPPCRAKRVSWLPTAPSREH
jgi:hypothetical protein